MDIIAGSNFEVGMNTPYNELPEEMRNQPSSIKTLLACYRLGIKSQGIETDALIDYLSSPQPEDEFIIWIAREKNMSLYQTLMAVSELVRRGMVKSDWAKCLIKGEDVFAPGVLQ